MEDGGRSSEEGVGRDDNLPPSDAEHPQGDLQGAGAAADRDRVPGLVTRGEAGLELAGARPECEGTRLERLVDQSQNLGSVLGGEHQAGGGDIQRAPRSDSAGWASGRNALATLPWPMTDCQAETR